jgi:hypothetical protein
MANYKDTMDYTTWVTVTKAYHGGAEGPQQLKVVEDLVLSM